MNRTRFTPALFRLLLLGTLLLLLAGIALAQTGGGYDLTWSTIDLDGVALAAIQGLYGLVQEKDAEIAALRAANTTMEAEIAALKAENAKLNDRLAAIEQALQANGTPVRVAASPAVLPQGGIALLGMLGGLVIGGAIMHWRRAGGGR